MKSQIPAGMLVSVCLIISVSSCVHRSGPYNPATTVSLQLQRPSPETYSVAVMKNDYPVPPNGQLTVTIPPLGRSSSLYLFGFIKIHQSSPYDIPAIELRRQGKLIRTLSLRDIDRLAGAGKTNEVILIK